MRPAERFYKLSEGRPILIQRVCEYLRMEDCKGCPEWEDGGEYGPVQRGCRMLAEELIAVVAQGLELAPGEIVQDNSKQPR